MSIFGFLRDLTASVGDRMTNRDEDVRGVKGALHELGHFDFGSDPEPHSYVTRPFDDAIKKYQSERGLKTDGILHPGGKTQRSLMSDLIARQEKRPELVFSKKNEPREGWQRTSSSLPRYNLGTIAERFGDFLRTASETGQKEDRTVLRQYIQAKNVQSGRSESFGPPKPKNDQQNQKQISAPVNRKSVILNDRKVGFSIEDNIEAKDIRPWYENSQNSQVQKYQKIIEERAKKADVDPNLVKAIMYMETTHGYYDKALDKVGLNKSVLPMNINVKYWDDLGFSREDLHDPEKNIQVGIALLKRIRNQVPDGNIRKVASLYNNLGASKVSDYGARVAAIYKEKPWENR